MKQLPELDLEHILDRTRGLWDELRGERIFITGGTGFFGKWLLESLLWANDRLHLDCRSTVLTRDPDKFRKDAPHLAGHRTVSVIQGDVRNFDFPVGNFSHVIHAATESSEKLNIQRPLIMLETIVEGTRRTLEFAKSAGTRRFLLTSSGAVYGKQPSDVTHVPEEYIGAPNPLDPRSAYGEGKRVAEHLCCLYADAILEVKIARGFAFVGPYLPLDIHFAIGNFIRDAMHGGPILVKGDGTPLRSYLYMADLTIWLWTILILGVSLRPYNVGSDEGFSIESVAKAVAKAALHQVQVQVIQESFLKQSPERYVPSTQRAQQELKLKQTVSLNEAIHRTINYHRRSNNG
jgi:nucleoside-diphosphate-sugar epimerase